MLPRVSATTGQGIRAYVCSFRKHGGGNGRKDIEIIGVNSLSELAGILSGRIEAAGHWFDEAMFREEDRLSYPVDYDEMLGLPTVRRACQVRGVDGTTSCLSDLPGQAKQWRPGGRRL